LFGIIVKKKGMVMLWLIFPYSLGQIDSFFHGYTHILVSTFKHSGAEIKKGRYMDMLVPLLLIPFSYILFGHYMDDICVTILKGIWRIGPAGDPGTTSSFNYNGPLFL
jgi:hypothetical protein